MDYKKKYLKYKLKYNYLKQINSISTEKIHYEKYQIGGGVLPTIIYFFNGMGCNPTTTGNRKQFLDNHALLYKCHPKGTKAALRAIFSAKFNLSPTKNSSYVEEVVQEIYTNLKGANNTIIYGHSFGGLIVNRIAQLLNNLKDIIQFNCKLNNDVSNNLINDTEDELKNTPQLICATFGSIYISKFEKTSNINIINYMSSDDVALRLLKLKNKPIGMEVSEQFFMDSTCVCSYQNQQPKTNIIWIYFCKDNHIDYKKKRSTFQQIKKKLSIKGSNKEWQIHNNYNTLMFYLSQYKTNDIKIIKECVEDKKKNYNLKQNLNPLPIPM
jgi:hypothetical protein